MDKPSSSSSLSLNTPSLSNIKTFIPSTILEDIPKLESKEFLSNKGSHKPTKLNHPFANKQQQPLRLNGSLNVTQETPIPFSSSSSSSYTLTTHSSYLTVPNSSNHLSVPKSNPILPSPSHLIIPSSDASSSSSSSSSSLSSSYTSKSTPPNPSSKSSSNANPLIKKSIHIPSALELSSIIPVSKPDESISIQSSKKPIESVESIGLDKISNKSMFNARHRLAVPPVQLNTSLTSSFSSTSSTSDSIRPNSGSTLNPSTKKQESKRSSTSIATTTNTTTTNTRTPLNVFSRLKNYLDPDTMKSSASTTSTPLFDPNSRFIPYITTSIVDSNLTTTTSFYPSTSTLKEEFNSQGPSSRKEVIALREKMHAMLQKLGAFKPTHPYPHDIQNLLNLVQQENVIFSTVFQEIIRHVTMNLVERGELLTEIRDRYVNMFQQIPKVVETTYANFIAQCFINKKLKKEILRIRDELLQLTSLLSAYQGLNQKIIQDKDYQHLLDDFLKAEHVDDILKEYHTVYRWQRTRMEEHIHRLEQEKKIWVDAATCLSLRIATDHKLPDVAQLQRFEYGRLRAVNHINAILQSHHLAKGQLIESDMTHWLQKLTSCAHEIEKSDKKGLHILTSIVHEMNQFQGSLEVQHPELDELLTVTPLEEAKKYASVESALKLEELSLSQIHIYLKDWVDQMNKVSLRYTSERDEHLILDLSNLQKTLHAWLDPCTSLLKKAQKTESGTIYIDLQYELNELKNALEGWVSHLKIRVTGDDGLASHIISIQNHIEDKYTLLASKAGLGTITLEEKIALLDAVAHWSQQLTTVCAEYLNGSSSSKEKRLPMQLELWLTKLIDQLTTDLELQKEDNFKLHNSVIHWMVQLLMKTGLKPPDESWDTELQKLHHSMMTKIATLLQNSFGIELLSDDRKNLREVIKYYADAWYETAKRLLEKEKKNTLILLKKRKKQGLAIPKLVGKAMEISKALQKSDKIAALSEDAYPESWEEEKDEEKDEDDEDDDEDDEKEDQEEANEKGKKGKDDVKIEIGVDEETKGERNEKETKEIQNDEKENKLENRGKRKEERSREKKVKEPTIAETMEFELDSSYLEAGQDGKGTYSDVETVEPIPVESDSLYPNHRPYSHPNHHRG